MTKHIRQQPDVITNPATSDREVLEAQQDKQVAVKSELESSSSSVHYGHAHAQTAERYQQRRAEFAMKKRLQAEQAAQEPQKAAPVSERIAEGVESKAEQFEAAAEQKLDDVSAPERVKELALEAVKSVVGAAKEAAHGHPIAGVRKLAGDAVSGALKVAREVTNRSGGKH